MSSTFISTDKTRLPVVPLRDMVVFPHMMAPFIVGRESSVRALEVALKRPDKQLFLITQRDPKIDDPQRRDIQDIGVVARVIQNLKLPNGNVKVMVEGKRRARLSWRALRRESLPSSTSGSWPPKSSRSVRWCTRGCRERSASMSLIGGKFWMMGG